MEEHGAKVLSHATTRAVEIRVLVHPEAAESGRVGWRGGVVESKVKDRGRGGRLYKGRGRRDQNEQTCSCRGEDTA